MRTQSLALCMLAHSLLGCTHRQFVYHPYPGWGEEILLARQDAAPRLHMRLLLPPNPASTVGCILIVHGMHEYVGRYGEIAAHFARRFIVAGVDLRAHGLSNPVLFAADRAIRAGATAYEVSQAYLAQAELKDLKPMRADLHQALGYLSDRCDGQGVRRKPLFILSHSLGSLVAASYLMQTDSDLEPHRQVSGIILAGPAFSVPKVPGWRGWLENPWIDLSFHIHTLSSPHDEPLPLRSFNQVSALILVPLLDGLAEVASWPVLRRLFSPTTPRWVVDYLTDWEQEKARHLADGFIIRRSILRFVLGVEKEIIQFRRIMAGFDVPYLLIYAAKDPITPAWGNEDFAASTAHRHPDNLVLALPDKSHHEQLFSAPPLNRWLLGAIDRWLDRRLRALGSNPD